MPQAIDYAALAKQAGATESAPPPGGGAIDYAALAKAAGATDSQPPPAIAPPPSATSRFISGFGRTNPVSTTYNLAKGLITDPKKTIDQAVFDPVAREASLAKQSYQQGKPLEALGHAAGAIPLVGPPTAAIVERAQSGDVAGAAGEATGMGLTMGLAKPTLKTAGAATMEGARALPGGPPVLESLGARANRFSTREMTKAITPTGGPNKARLTALSERIAPQLARTPELTGVRSRGGLVSAVEDGLISAKEGLDQTLDQSMLQSVHGTDPIIKGLEAEQGKLMVRGNKGAAVPASRKAEYDTLQSMIDDVKKLGDSVDYENLRNLRQSWDAPAASAHIYAKTEAEFGQKSAGQAYANGAGVLRDYLANQQPAAAKANAKYALFANAHKVLRAAEQASVTQAPSTGRALVARGTGLLVGRELGGTLGEIGGVLVAPLVDRALSSTRTGFQVRVSQQLAKLADALQSGNQKAITAQVQTLRQWLPPMKTSLRLGMESGRFVGQPPPEGEGQNGLGPPPGPAR